MRGHRLLTIKGRFGVAERNSTVKFNNMSAASPPPQLPASDPIQLHCKGHFFAARDTRIHLGNTDAGPVVAHIERLYWNAKELVAGKQTYKMTVAQGMDVGVAVALCVAIDERRSENWRQKRAVAAGSARRGLFV